MRLSLLLLLAIDFFAIVVCADTNTEEKKKDVHIFHLIDNALWGEIDGTGLQGLFSCPSSAHVSSCRLVSTDVLSQQQSKHKQQQQQQQLKDNFAQNIGKKYTLFHQQQQQQQQQQVVTLALYNIHTWNLLSPWPHKPDKCLLPTHLSLVESEESTVRFKKLFGASFKHFDGNSTTHPDASVQRSYVYISAFNKSAFLPLKPHEQMIKGASYVVSTCHRGKHQPLREEVTSALQVRYRVDSLGKCHPTPRRKDTVVLKSGKTALESLQHKQAAISHYLFHLAFENFVEPGYVTEKVFDALIAGTVPVYLGPSNDCKRMLPNPKAAIFVDDFGQDIEKLASYLEYLTLNVTAYEEHRSGWRKSFEPGDLSQLVSTSWPCRLCEWAAQQDVSTTTAAAAAAAAACLQSKKNR